MTVIFFAPFKTAVYYFRRKYNIILNPYTLVQMWEKLLAFVDIKCV